MCICKEISHQENILPLYFDIKYQRISSVSYFVKDYKYIQFMKEKKRLGEAKQVF